MRQYLSPISRVAFLTAAFVCMSPARLGAADKQLANEPAAPQLAFAINVGAGKTVQQVHDAVIASASHRGWAITSNATDQVVIHLARHRYDATVTFDITSEKVTAYCKSYPKQPTSWLNYLREDITKALNGLPLK